MKKQCIIVVLIIIFGCTSVFGQDHAALFETANTAYNQEKYQEAITTYNQLLSNGVYSAELYYNLANAYYKTNEIGPSVYYYEKALQLSPNDEDIQNNLAFAQNMTIDAIEPLPQTQVAKFTASVTEIFTYNQWAWIAVILTFLCVLAFLGYQFSYQSIRKRVFFFLSFIFLFFMFISVGIAYHQYNKALQDKPAIVFAESTAVRSEPNLRSQEVFTLHEGTKVQIEETVNNWKKIRLIDGKIGWIVTEDIKEL